MTLVVTIPFWVLEEDLRIISIGDTLASWLNLNHDQKWAVPAERLQRIRGHATALQP